MELAEALQNGLVAPRRANLDSFFLQNPLYAEGTVNGTHALAGEGKSTAYASGPPVQKMSYASKAIGPLPRSVHDASKGKGIAQDCVFSPSSSNVGEGHSNPHMGLGNDTTNSGKTEDSVLVIECVALEEWFWLAWDSIKEGFRAYNLSLLFYDSPWFGFLQKSISFNFAGRLTYALKLKLDHGVIWPMEVSGRMLNSCSRSFSYLSYVLLGLWAEPKVFGILLLLSLTGSD
ncbi:hypothetical protein L7F22_008037 [Adiantum nelumboides]|nr:hypothetical protein [Adiantum nelumboides]